MNLTLAIVESCTDTGCCVRLIPRGRGEQTGTGSQVEALYARPIIDCNLAIKPTDLVAIELSERPYQAVARWQSVTVCRIEESEIFIDDTISQSRIATYSENTNLSLGRDVVVGDKIFLWGNEIVDFAIDGVPAQAERLIQYGLPQIETLYEHLGAEKPWRTTLADSLSRHQVKEIVAQSYDQIAESYLAWSQNVRKEERAHYTKLILESLPKGADVLELGCATATQTTPQLVQRFRLTCTDISPRQIEIARKRMPLIDFICADMTKLNFLPESLDGVVAFYSIIHVPRHEQPALLEKIASWLRPRGLFVASFTVNSTEGGYEEDWLGAPMYWSGYDSATTIRLIEEAGLDIISAEEETEDEFGNPITFLWVVAKKPKG